MSEFSLILIGGVPAPCARARGAACEMDSTRVAAAKQRKIPAARYPVFALFDIQPPFPVLMRRFVSLNPAAPLCRKILAWRPISPYLPLGKTRARRTSIPDPAPAPHRHRKTSRPSKQVATQPRIDPAAVATAAKSRIGLPLFFAN